MKTMSESKRIWAIVLVCASIVGCAENGDSVCIDTAVTDNRSSQHNDSITPLTNDVSYIQGPDDSATLPVVHVVLVSGMSAAHTWTISSPNTGDPSTMRFVARDVPGEQILINRLNGTTIAAFNGDDRGWLTVQRYDDGGGDNWNAVGWFGGVTIPGDP